MEINVGDCVALQLSSHFPRIRFFVVAINDNGAGDYLVTLANAEDGRDKIVRSMWKLLDDLDDGERWYRVNAIEALSDVW